MISTIQILPEVFGFDASGSGSGSGVNFSGNKTGGVKCPVGKNNPAVFAAGLFLIFFLVKPIV